MLVKSKVLRRNICTWWNLFIMKSHMYINWDEHIWGHLWTRLFNTNTLACFHDLCKNCWSNAHEDVNWTKYDGPRTFRVCGWVEKLCTWAWCTKFDDIRCKCCLILKFQVWLVVWFGLWQLGGTFVCLNIMYKVWWYKL